MFRHNGLYVGHMGDGVKIGQIHSGAILTQVQSLQCTAAPWGDGPVSENSELWHLISVRADGKYRIGVPVKIHAPTSTKP